MGGPFRFNFFSQKFDLRPWGIPLFFEKRLEDTENKGNEVAKIVRGPLGVGGWRLDGRRNRLQGME